MMFRNGLKAVVLTVVLAGVGFPVWGQDEATPPSWEALVKAREAAFDRLREIRNNVQTAEPDEQQKMIAEYQKTVTRLTTQIFPALEQQLPATLNARPEDPQVLEIAGEIMRYAFSRNRFDRSQQLAELLLSKDADDAVAANIAGVSRFANHDFDGSLKILTALQERDQLIDDLGGRYLDSAQTYVDYWKTEQQIREREDAATGEDALPRVQLKTSKGDIVLELFENEAPNTVANFISLVEKDYYDGLKFHRVIPSFMAQGGCPHSRDGDPGQPGTGGPGYNIKCEAYAPNARRHFAGSLSMAHAGRDTGGSQFFITHLPTPHLDREIVPTSVHTVFGRVVQGLDVVRALEPDDVIADATVVRKRSHEYKPQTVE